MVTDTIKALRERIQRREAAKRASRRAKARRIAKEKPEGPSETARVTAKQTGEQIAQTSEEARGLAEDAKQLISTELGLSESESESFIQEASSLLEGAGDSLGELDIDGDGDSDLMAGFDQSIVEPEESGGTAVVDPTEPIMDFGKATEPVMRDLDLEKPIEERIFK